MAEIHTLPQPLERLATQIKHDLERRKQGNREWIEGTFDLCIHLAQAKLDKPALIDFGQWCTDNGFGQDVLNKDDRAAAIAMGENPEALRKCLEETGRKNLQLIHAREFHRYLSDQKTKGRKSGGGTKKSHRVPEVSPKVEMVRQMIRPTMEAGRPISREKLKETYKEHKITERDIRDADYMERARAEVLHEKIDDAVVENIILPMTAQQKLDTVIRRERKLLEAEMAKRRAEMDEEVRQKVLARGAEYLANLNAMQEKAKAAERWHRQLINNHQPPFNEAEFMSIWRCLHSDSRGSLSAARLDAAFTLFNSKRLVLTGKK